MMHRALEDLLCCLCTKEEVNVQNLHLNIKYGTIALLECGAYVTSTKGDRYLNKSSHSVVIVPTGVKAWNRNRNLMSISKVKLS